jgi:hypothetical protein
MIASPSRRISRRRAMYLALAAALLVPAALLHAQAAADDAPTSAPNAAAGGETSGETSGGGRNPLKRRPPNPLLNRKKDPFVGEFKNDEIAITITKTAGKYAGQIIQGEMTFPVHATLDGETLKGSFKFQNFDYTFTATVKDDQMSLASEGELYQLARVEEAQTPLASATPDKPSVTPPTPVRITPTPRPPATAPAPATPTPATPSPATPTPTTPAPTPTPTPVRPVSPPATPPIATPIPQPTIPPPPLPSPTTPVRPQPAARPVAPAPAASSSSRSLLSELFLESAPTPNLPDLSRLADEPARMQTARHTSGFTLRYPADWQEQSNPKAVILIPKGVERDVSDAPMVLIQVRRASARGAKDVTEPAVIGVLDDFISLSYPGLKRQSQVEGIDSLLGPGIAVTYDGTLINGLDSRAVVYAVLDGDQITYLVHAARADLAAAHRSAARRIFASIGWQAADSANDMVGVWSATDDTAATAGTPGIPGGGAALNPAAGGRRYLWSFLADGTCAYTIDTARADSPSSGGARAAAAASAKRKGAWSVIRSKLFIAWEDGGGLALPYRVTHDASGLRQLTLQQAGHPDFVLFGR